MNNKCVWCKELKDVATSCTNMGETRYICKDCYAEISQTPCQICNTKMKLSDYEAHLIGVHKHEELAKALVTQEEFNVLFYPKYT